MVKNIALISAGFLLPLSLVACDGAGGSASSTAAAGSGKPAATATATAAAAEPVEEKMTEYDLSSVGDKWKGYTAKLPREGAKVMGDMDGARLATNGREKNPFDIAWGHGKGDIAMVKKGLEAAGKSGVKTEFTVDTPEGIEYINTFESGTKSYHLYLVMKVGTEDFHCYTLPMGVKDEAQYKKHKEACKTLAKK